MKQFIVKSNHDVYVDSFSDGEGEYIQSYTLDGQINCEDSKEAIFKYFESIGYNLDFANCEVSEDGYLQTSCLVNRNNEQPTNKEVELWKEDKHYLFVNHITLTVYELKEVLFN